MNTLRGCCCCAVMLLASAASSASEAILAPIADGSILDQAPFNGIGDAGGIENDQIVSVGLNSRILDSRGVVEYDLTQVNRDKPVQSAILRMKVTGKGFLPGTTIAPVQVMGYRGDGTLQRNDFNMGTFVTVYDAFAANNGAVIEVNVTRFVRAAVQRRAQHYVGFSFRTNVHGFFRSYESLDTGEPIQLVVVQ
jgi:hypothetical protein